MEKIITVIKSVPIFSGLADDEIEAVFQINVDRKYNRGEIIFSDGENADGFYVVATGKVKIFKMSFNVKEQILHSFQNQQPNHKLTEEK